MIRRVKVPWPPIVAEDCAPAGLPQRRSGRGAARRAPPLALASLLFFLRSRRIPRCRTAGRWSRSRKNEPGTPSLQDPGAGGCWAGSSLCAADGGAGLPRCPTPVTARGRVAEARRRGAPLASAARAPSSGKETAWTIECRAGTARGAARPMPISRSKFREAGPTGAARASDVRAPGATRGPCWAKPGSDAVRVDAPRLLPRGSGTPAPLVFNAYFASQISQ